MMKKEEKRSCPQISWFYLSPVRDLKFKSRCLCTYSLPIFAAEPRIYWNIFLFREVRRKKKRWRCALRPYYIIAMTGIIIFCGNWICSFWQILCRLMNMYEDVVKIYRRSSILFIFLRSYAALYVCFSCMKIFVLSGQIFLGVYVYTCIFFLVCTNVGTALMQINRLF